MKRADIILIAAICLIALLTVPLARALRQKDASSLIITVNGEIFGTYPLDEDRIIRIGDTNVCEIRDGKARMTEADCPDHSCVRSKPIGSGGGSIVCLPNRVILRTAGEEDDEGPDTIAG